jgi:hypothetical protein
MGIFGDEKIHSLLDDINDTVTAICMTPSLNWKSADKSDHGFTPMSLSKFFDQNSPDNNVDAFLNVLKEARTKVVLPISAHKPDRKIRHADPLVSREQESVEFYSSVFDEDVDDNYESDDNDDDDGHRTMMMMPRAFTPAKALQHESISMVRDSVSLYYL